MSSPEAVSVRPNRPNLDSNVALIQACKNVDIFYTRLVNLRTA